MGLVVLSVSFLASVNSFHIRGVVHISHVRETKRFNSCLFFLTEESQLCIVHAFSVCMFAHVHVSVC